MAAVGSGREDGVQRGAARVGCEMPRVRVAAQVRRENMVVALVAVREGGRENGVRWSCSAGQGGRPRGRGGQGVEVVRTVRIKS